MITWDILVVTIPHRHEKLCALLASLDSQLPWPGVRVRLLRDNLRAAIGDKRQALLEASRADYVSFVDDDDRLAPCYVARITAALAGEPDYVGFPVRYRDIGENQVRMTMQMSGYRREGWHWPPVGGVIGVDAQEAAELCRAGLAVRAEPDDIPFQLIEHSLRHGGWDQALNQVRDLSHLNPLRRELALLGSFAGAGFAEDIAWAAQLRATGQVRTETFIAEPMYYYDYRMSDCSKTSREPLKIIPRLPSYPWLRVVNDDHVGRADLLDTAPGRDPARAAG